ncbi:hypothetical protein ACP70R_033751 [Stipagrostis hirtigluma subsp. patula]
MRAATAAALRHDAGRNGRRVCHIGGAAATAWWLRQEASVAHVTRVWGFRASAGRPAVVDADARGAPRQRAAQTHGAGASVVVRHPIR